MNSNHRTNPNHARRACGSAVKQAGINCAWELVSGGDPRAALESGVEGGVQGMVQDAVGYLLRRELTEATGRTAAREFGKLSVKELSKMTVRQVGRSAFRSNAITGTAAFAAETAVDCYKLAVGKIDAHQFGVRAGTNAATELGSAGGATAGAIIGTLILPGPGTVVGGLLGSIGGSLGSRAAMRAVLSKLQPQDR